MQKILIVEDSEETQTLIRRVIENLGYELFSARTTKEARAAVETNRFDLILLDISLPDGSGLDLCVELQARSAPAAGTNKRAPLAIIFLTGKGEIGDKVAAFSLGAEDYIVKPFNALELRARIEAKMKRLKGRSEEEQVIEVGDLRINLMNHEAHLVIEDVDTRLGLSPLELKILTHLARQPDRAFSRDQLVAAAWGDSSDVVDRTVDSHICSLRKKLGAYGRCIESVVNVGYKLVPPKKDKHAA